MPTAIPLATVAQIAAVTASFDRVSGLIFFILRFLEHNRQVPMCLCAECSCYIHRNVHILPALVVQHQRFHQPLILYDGGFISACPSHQGRAAFLRIGYPARISEVKPGSTLDQALILVCCQRSGKFGLHQRTFAAAITSLPDFQGVGSFCPPLGAFLLPPCDHAMNSSQEQGRQRSAPPPGGTV